ncbi:MAG: NADH-quinone oxidoreductase subunit N [Marinoscillum sp.]|jgi:NADH-quinone oxidoreductase subunit N
MLTQKLLEISQNLGVVSYEITLTLGAIAVLILGLITKRLVLSKIAFVLTLVIALAFLGGEAEGSFLAFGGTLFFDIGVVWLKILFAIVGVWIVFFPSNIAHRSEYYFLILALILGSTLMLTANNLLIIYLAVELTSFSAYILTSLKFEKKSFEASIKYLIFGGVTSALALYGASLVYGFTGTLYLHEMDFTILANQELLNLGLILFCGSLFFKVSAVPFHIWTPAVYQESPTDAVMVMSIVPKLGGFYLLHRVLTSAQFLDQSWLYTSVTVLGIATVIIGTFGALRQSNLKRMVAYGAIAHSGFLMATLIVPFESGASAFIWYAFGYAIINIAAFYYVAILEDLGNTELSGLAGLGQQLPYFGALGVIIALALIGLPPTVGFSVKFYLFVALWEWYQNVNDPFVLAYLFTAVLSVVFSLFFYFRIPYQMFFKSGESTISTSVNISHQILATIFTAVLFWLFFSPEIFNNIAKSFTQIDW